jgi:hypothetical protein
LVLMSMLKSSASRITLALRDHSVITALSPSGSVSLPALAIFPYSRSQKESVSDQATQCAQCLV